MPTLTRGQTVTLEATAGQRIDVSAGGIVWQTDGDYVADFTQWPLIIGPFTSITRLALSAVAADITYEIFSENEYQTAAVIVDSLPDYGRTGLIYLTPEGAKYFYEVTGEFLAMDGTPSEPENDTAPVIAGEAEVDAVLTVTSLGVWNFRPTSFAYQWQIDGADVEGETGISFIVPEAAEGEDVTCNVIAINAVGDSDPAASNAIAIPGS